jgi:ubiquinone/menaquinone biosynthesis C-methylase UbiE
MDEHWARDDVVAEYSSFDFLLEPERMILQEIRPRLAGMRMLDIGVGGGRTTQHFMDLVGEYVGVDYSPKMIQACKRRFEEPHDRVSFHVMDARDMSGLTSGSFDLVLFSFNGLDLVGSDQDRLRALEEIHRVCRQGGMFCFSSHNMDFVRVGFSVTRSVRRLLKSRAIRKRPSELIRRPDLLLDAVKRPIRWRSLNPDRRSLFRAGHGVVVERRPRYELTKSFYSVPDEQVMTGMYYIQPHREILRLRQVGFDEARLFAPDGTEVTDRATGDLSDHWWVYYLCTRRASPRA